jgi:streptomycin 6-kinase
VLPDDVRRTIESQGDPGGRAWIDALPDIVGHLCTVWSLTPGPVLAGGRWSLVMRIRQGDADAVLKVAPPGAGFGTELATLAAAEGRGYVRLLASDAGERAALLEPLGDSLFAHQRPIDDQLDILAATLVTAWRVPRPRPAAAAGRKAAELRDLIATEWTRLGGPCSVALRNAALAYADRRLADGGRPTVLCHGDPHPGNALAVLRPRAGAESGFVFVDPDGFIDSPGYDLGVTIRSFTDEVRAAADPVGLVRGWCRRLSASTGVDAEEIWQWAFIERVSSGLYLMARGHDDEGRMHLASAERLVG